MSDWQLIDGNTPRNRLLLLACNDWAPSLLMDKPVPVKIGGHWDGAWRIFGASWTPTHWMEAPEGPPKADVPHVSLHTISDQNKPGELTEVCIAPSGAKQ